MDKFVAGVVAMGLVTVFLLSAYNYGRYRAQLDVRAFCEKYQVVDLPLAGAAFYCQREPIK